MPQILQFSACGRAKKRRNAMHVYPAIDIRGGNAVRLVQGDYSREKVYSINPVDVALKFKEAGARRLHVVDLDGALEGELVNKDIIKKIVEKCGLFVQVGGGVRSVNRISEYLSAGASRVILGSAAVEDEGFVKDAVRFFGDKVAVGVDALGGKVAIGGWKKVTDIDAYGFCEKLCDDGVKTVICTDISRDGVLGGTNLSAYERLVGIKGLRVIASGGITYYDELEKLKGMGVRGAVIGKAVYDGAIDLSRAVRMCEDAR